MYICFRLCREHTFQLLFQIIYKMEILRKLEMFPICPLITSYMSAKSYSSSKSKVSSKSILLPKVHVCQKCFLMVLPKLTSKSVYNRKVTPDANEVMQSILKYEPTERAVLSALLTDHNWFQSDLHRS